MSARRALVWVAAFFALATAAIVAIGYAGAVADPVVRPLTVRLADFPAGAPPVRILLFSDVHVHGPDMAPERVRRIVSQINGLHPDIIVAAGDFVGNNLVGRDYTIGAAIAPLAGLKATYGVYAVLGNNDYLEGGELVRRELQRAGVVVLQDNAVRAGPLALGGYDGRLRSHPRHLAARRQTNQAMRRISGAKVLVAHRSDEFLWARRRADLVLTGHTHCGQIVLPLVGPLQTGSDYGRRWVCGPAASRNGSAIALTPAKRISAVAVTSF